jgi:hypothetical protein
MKTNRKYKTQYNESKKKSKFRKDIIRVRKQLAQSCNDPNLVICSPHPHFDIDCITPSELVGGPGYLWSEDIHISKAIDFDYREIGRKLVQELPQGALPLYGWSGEKMFPISEIKGRRYYIKD